MLTRDEKTILEALEGNYRRLWVDLRTMNTPFEVWLPLERETNH